MILVTGGTGLLGGHLLRKLVSQGVPVRAVHRGRFPEWMSTEVREQVQWVQGDILDVLDLEQLFEGVTEVYHCAGYVSFDPKHKQQMLHLNRVGTANIVNFCLDFGVRKLVHVSSIAALGRAKDGLQLDEKTEWEESKKNTGYAVSKYLAEMEVWRGIAEGLEAVIVNPAIILGPGNYEQSSAKLMKKVAEGFPWYTTGTNGFVDVDDVTEAMVQLMESDIRGERFVVSGGNFTYEEVLKAMAQALDVKPPHKPVTPVLSKIIWRVEKIRSWLTGKDPLITRETTRTALMHCYYNNTKLLGMLPGFSYTPLLQTTQKMAQHFRNK
jgi:nucleoside-diphosphate-sugar epimerase